MIKRIADFYKGIMDCRWVFHALCLIMTLIPIGIAIGVTIDYHNGIVYEDIPLWFAWGFGITSSFCLLGLWSLSWDL